VTAPKLRFGLLVVILAVLALPGTASAALSVTAQSTTVTEAGSARNGVVEGGDTVDVAVELRNTGATTLTGLHATLSSTSPVVAVLDAADYPDLDPFDSAAGLTPFRVHLPSVACGESVTFTLNASAGGETADVPITVVTGGTPATFESYSQPTTFPIPDGLPTLQGATLASLVTPGTAVSTINVPMPASGGRVKDVQVHFPRIDSPNIGHLRIRLFAPNGDSAVLLDHRGAGAQVLSNTVFAANGAALSSSSPPYTGTFRPEGDLTSLYGGPVNGIWKLRVDLDDRTEHGQIQGWSVDIKAADCTPRSYAALTVTPSQVEPNQAAVLDASASVDTEGTDPRYAFDVDGNGTYETDNGSDPTYPVSFPTHGLKHVGVQLSDGATIIGTATATLAVSKRPTARIVVPLGGLTPDSGQTVTFNGTTSDDFEDGTALQHQWSVDGGPYTTGDSLTFAQSFPKKGSHVVSLRVTDLDGASDTAEVTVEVQNRAPTASLALSAPPAARGRVTTFDGSSTTDPDGTIAHYEWDLDGNGSYETDGGASPTTTKTYAATGSVTVGLRVTDDDGGVDTETLPVAITEAPVVGTLSALPAQPRPGANVTFTLSSAGDPDGGPVTYAWSFGDGATKPVGGLSESHTYATAATVNVTVTVTDDEGAKTTATLPFVVSGLAPVAALSATPNPIETGAAVVFDASGSDDPDSTIVNYRWDLDGDNFFERDSGDSPTVSRSYPNATALTARVRVTDDDGHSTVAAVNISIQGPLAPPTDPGAGGADPGAGPTAGGGAGAGSGGTGGGDGSGGTSGGGGAGGGSAGAVGARFTAALAAAPIQKLKAVMNGGVAATCRTSRAGRCTVRLELAGADARRLGLSRSKAKTFVLARATVRTDSAKATKVALRISRAVAAKLRRAARVTVTVAGEAVDAAGNSASFKRAVLLRNR
jgi:subtilisin-like proprotein convertase family protein